MRTAVTQSRTATTLPVIAPLAQPAYAACATGRSAFERPATSEPANASWARVLTAARSAATTRRRRLPLASRTVAVIVAVPVPTAVTSPVALTPATAGSEVTQL